MISEWIEKILTLASDFSEELFELFCWIIFLSACIVIITFIPLFSESISLISNKL